MNTHFNTTNSLCLTVAEALALGNLLTLVCAWLVSPTFVFETVCSCFDTGPVFKHNNDPL